MAENQLTTTASAPDITSEASSTHSASGDQRGHDKNRRNTTADPLLTTLSTQNPNPSTSKTPHSLFAKLTDAKNSLFGKSSTPDPFFRSAEEDKALLSYILSEPHPRLDTIQEFERNGAHLNAVTDDGNTALHLLAKAELHSNETISIVDYLIKRGCDPNRQNDYGWTAGMNIDE